MKKYIKNNINNPKFLFHGSPKLLEVIEQRQSHDSNNNSKNEDYAVFLTSSFIIATAYAFKDKIKEISKELNWEFNIGKNTVTGKIFIEMDNVNIDDNMIGYVYVFPFEKTYEHDTGSIQYKCYKNIKPLDIIEVKFSDYKKFYKINNKK